MSYKKSDGNFLEMKVGIYPGRKEHWKLVAASSDGGILNIERTKSNETTQI